HDDAHREDPERQEPAGEQQVVRRQVERRERQDGERDQRREQRQRGAPGGHHASSSARDRAAIRPRGRSCRKATTNSSSATFAVLMLVTVSATADSVPISSAAIAVPRSVPIPPRMTTRNASTM